VSSLSTYVPKAQIKATGTSGGKPSESKNLTLFRFIGGRDFCYNYYKPDPSLYDRTKANVRSRLGEEGFEEAWAEGRAMTFEQAVEYALGRDAASSPGSN
jgi:hypothetical protein